MKVAPLTLPLTSSLDKTVEAVPTSCPGINLCQAPWLSRIHTSPKAVMTLAKKTLQYTEEKQALHHDSSLMSMLAEDRRHSQGEPVLLNEDG